MKVMVTADCHGVFTRFYNLPKDEEIKMIVLGDFGINFYLNKTDTRKKKELCANYPNITFYVLHGNHEARPQDIPGMTKQFDDFVHGVVYLEPEFPNIRYFLDYGFYDIAGYTCFVISGAYSVDKHWRLMRAGMTEKTNDPKKTGWFTNEQLTEEEMRNCDRAIQQFVATGKTVDFVFSHTCPYRFQPTDLFLSAVDQSTVDNSMELWMNHVFEQLSGYVWLFGHYHADRIEAPHIEQLYNDMENLDDIYNRWQRYDTTGELDWWLVKGGRFYEHI